MKVTIEASKLSGSILAPASKSAAHRLLICAGLSQGKSSISNLSMSKDILATLACLQSLGIDWSDSDNRVQLKGLDWEQVHKAKVLPDFPCNECGSTLRFMIPICLLLDKEVTLTGTEKLLSRPLEVYEEICKKQGLKLENQGKKLKVRGPLQPGDYTVKGNISSQFISGLLFALPLLAEDSAVLVENPYESKPYVDMTLDALKLFGIRINTMETPNGETMYVIPGRQQYKAHNAAVEGDWSNAAFFFALKMLGADISIEGLDYESYQGDKICIDYMEQIKKGPCSLDLADCPDLAPILFAFAGMNHGAHFTGTKRLAFKESDRVQAMADELKAFGIDVKASENEVDIIPIDFHAPTRMLSGHNDHRIVMALAVMCLITGGQIEGAQAVEKSFPDFFERLKDLGAELVTEA